jgi:hypothetical protein
MDAALLNAKYLHLVVTHSGSKSATISLIDHTRFVITIPTPA